MHADPGRATSEFPEVRVPRLTKMSRPLSQSLSSPSIRQIGGKASRSHPLCQGLVLVKPFLDQYGYSHCHVKNAAHMHDWDERHQLVDATNELRPAGTRQYFSSPQTVEELEGFFSGSSSCQSLLDKLHKPEVMPQRSVISCDNGPSTCPERYDFGGNMYDRDGKVRTWNDRWTKGIGLLNDIVILLTAHISLRVPSSRIHPHKAGAASCIKKSPAVSGCPASRENHHSSAEWAE